MWCFFFFQAEDGIRDSSVTGVQTCALPISYPWHRATSRDYRNRRNDSESKRDRWSTLADRGRARCGQAVALSSLHSQWAAGRGGNDDHGEFQVKRPKNGAVEKSVYFRGPAAWKSPQGTLRRRLKMPPTG